jgi:TP901 family phage tail tape measure protein
MAFNVTLTANVQLGPGAANALRSQLASALSSVGVNVKLNFPANVNPQIAALARAAAQAQSALNALGPAGGAAAAGLARAGQAASGSTSSLARFLSTATNAARSLDRSAGAMEAFGKQAALAARRFVSFSLVAGSLIAVQNAFRSAISDAIAFDREMVRLAQVSSDSARSVASVGETVTSLARQFGVSSRELIDTAVVFRQAGLSIDQTKIALQGFAKALLAPNFGSARETAEGAIAIYQQFGQSVEKLESQLGAVNAVAGEFAVEAGDLVTAIQKAGGSFAAAGGDLNELLALFTSVRATTRESAEEISTGLRTIFARIQRRDTVEALRGIGVELRYVKEEADALGDPDLEGKFVKPLEAARRIAEGLSRVDPGSEKFAAALEAIGGYRQISRVVPLVQQFATTQKALNVAQAGQNSLTLAAEKGSASYLVRITKLKEEFLGLVRAIGDQPAFKALADFFLQGATLAVKFVEAIKPVVPALLALGAAATFRGSLGVFRGFASNIGNPSPARRFATGGRVPGSGRNDHVPALLEPGEYVVPRQAAQRIGYQRLERMRFAQGGPARVARLDDTKMGGADHVGIVAFQRQRSLGAKSNLIVPLSSLSGSASKTALGYTGSKSGEEKARTQAREQFREAELAGTPLLPGVEATPANLKNRYIRRRLSEEIVPKGERAARTRDFEAEFANLYFSKAKNRTARLQQAVGPLTATDSERQAIFIARQLNAYRLQNSALLRSQFEAVEVPLRRYSFRSDYSEKVRPLFRQNVEAALANTAAGVLASLPPKLAPKGELRPGSPLIRRVYDQSITNQGSGRFFEAVIAAVAGKAADTKNQNFDFVPPNPAQLGELLGLPGNVFADAKLTDNPESRKSIAAKAVRQFGIKASQDEQGRLTAQTRTIDEAVGKTRGRQLDFLGNPEAFLSSIGERTIAEATATRIGQRSSSEPDAQFRQRFGLDRRRKTKLVDRFASGGTVVPLKADYGLEWQAPRVQSILRYLQRRTGLPLSELIAEVHLKQDLGDHPHNPGQKATGVFDIHSQSISLDSQTVRQRSFFLRRLLAHEIGHALDFGLGRTRAGRITPVSAGGSRHLGLSEAASPLAITRAGILRGEFEPLAKAGLLPQAFLDYLASPEEGFAELFADYATGKPAAGAEDAVRSFGANFLPLARQVLGVHRLPPDTNRLIRRFGYARGGRVRLASGGPPSLNSPSDWAHTLSDDEYAALLRYTGGGYREINGSLRGQRPFRPFVLRQARALQSLLLRTSLPTDIHLWRGISQGELRKHREAGLDLTDPSVAGRFVTLPGFLSTSTDPNIADAFAKRRGRVLRVLGERGDPGAPLGSWSKHPEEKEVLLPHGQTYKILGVEPDITTLARAPVRPRAFARGGVVTAENIRKILVEFKARSGIDFSQLLGGRQIRVRSDAFLRQMLSRDRSFAKNYGTTAVKGLFAHDGLYLNSDRIRTIDELRAFLAHEFGHAADFALGGGKALASTTSGTAASQFAGREVARRVGSGQFADVLRQSTTRLPGLATNAQRPSYLLDRSEAFADTFRNFLLDNDSLGSKFSRRGFGRKVIDPLAALTGGGGRRRSWREFLFGFASGGEIDEALSRRIAASLRLTYARVGLGKIRPDRLATYFVPAQELAEKATGIYSSNTRAIALADSGDADTNFGVAGHELTHAALEKLEARRGRRFFQPGSLSEAVVGRATAALNLIHPGTLDAYFEGALAQGHSYDTALHTLGHEKAAFAADTVLTLRRMKQVDPLAVPNDRVARVLAEPELLKGLIDAADFAFSAKRLASRTPVVPSTNAEAADFLLPNIAKRSQTVPRFALGGLVPGTGNTDSVPADLPVGSYVIRKSSVARIGAGNLAALAGGRRKFARGGRSGKGVVPALVMPGEYVFTPDQAARVGTSTLDRINRHARFATGGRVGLASGGPPGFPERVETFPSIPEFQRATGQTGRGAAVGAQIQEGIQKYLLALRADISAADAVAEASRQLAELQKRLAAATQAETDAAAASTQAKALAAQAAQEEATRNTQIGQLRQVDQLGQARRRNLLDQARNRRDEAARRDPTTGDYVNDPARRNVLREEARQLRRQADAEATASRNRRQTIRNLEERRDQVVGGLREQSGQKEQEAAALSLQADAERKSTTLAVRTDALGRMTLIPGLTAAKQDELLAQGPKTGPNTLGGVTLARSEQAIQSRLGVDASKVSEVTRATFLAAEETRVREEYIRSVARQIRAIDQSIPPEEARRLAEQRYAKALDQGATVLLTASGRVEGDSTLGADLAAARPNLPDTGRSRLGQRFADTFDSARSFVGRGIDRINNSRAGRFFSRGLDRLNLPNSVGLQIGLTSLAPLAGQLFEGPGADRSIGTASAEQTFTRNRGVSGALTGAGVGAGIGLAFGPQAAIAGAAIGGIVGFADSVRRAEEEIRQARIGRAVDQVGQALQNLAQGIAAFDSETLGRITTRQNEAANLNSESAFQTSSTAYNRFFQSAPDFERFATELSREERSNFGGQAATIAQVLNRRAELSGKEVSRDPGFASADPTVVAAARSRLRSSIFDANDGFGQKQLSLLARLQGVPIATLEKSFLKVAEEARRSAAALRAETSARAAVGRASNNFEQLASGVRTAGITLGNQSVAARSSVELLDGAAPARVRGVSENLASFPNTDPAAFRNALGAVASQLGEGGTSLSRTGETLNALSEALPSVLAGIRSRPLAPNMELSGAIRDGLQAALAARGVTGSEAQRLTGTVSSQFLNPEDFEKFLAEAGGDISKAAERALSPVAAPFRETLGNLSRDFEAAANDFSDGLADLARRARQTAADQSRVDELALEAQRNRARVQARQTGRSEDAIPSLRDLEAPFRLRQLRLTGLNEADPAAISGRLADLLPRARAAEADYQQAFRKRGQDEGGFRAAAESLARLRSEATDLQQALRDLADASNRNAAVQERLSRLREDRDSRRNLGERLLSGGPDEIARAARGIALAASVRKNNFKADSLSSEDRRSLFDFLNSTSGVRLTGLGGLTGADFRNKVIDSTAGGAFGLDRSSAEEENTLERTLQRNLDQAAAAQQALVDVQKSAQEDFFQKLAASQQAFLAELLAAERRRQAFEAENDRFRQAESVGRLERQAISGDFLKRLGVTSNAGVDALRASRPTVGKVFALAGEQRRLESAKLSGEDAASILRSALAAKTPGGSDAPVYGVIGSALRERGLGDVEVGSVFQKFAAYQGGNNALQPGNLVSAVEDAVRERIEKIKTEKIQATDTLSSSELERVAPGSAGRIADAARDPALSEAKIYEAAEAFGRGQQSLEGLQEAIENARKSLELLTASAERARTAAFGPADAVVPVGKALGGPIFSPRGVDTVPAMLQPGEFVVRKDSARKNLSLLRHLNETGSAPGYARGGGVQYLAGGGIVGGIDRSALARDRQETQAQQDFERLSPSQREDKDREILREIEKFPGGEAGLRKVVAGSGTDEQKAAASGREGYLRFALQRATLRRRSDEAAARHRVEVQRVLEVQSVDEARRLGENLAEAERRVADTREEIETLRQQRNAAVTTRDLSENEARYAFFASDKQWYQDRSDAAAREAEELGRRLQAAQARMPSEQEALRVAREGGAAAAAREAAAAAAREARARVDLELEQAQAEIEKTAREYARQVDALRESVTTRSDKLSLIESAAAGRDALGRTAADRLAGLGRDAKPEDIGALVEEARRAAALAARKPADRRAQIEAAKKRIRSGELPGDGLNAAEVNASLETESAESQASLAAGESRRTAEQQARLELLREAQAQAIRRRAATPEAEKALPAPLQNILREDYLQRARAALQALDPAEKADLVGRWGEALEIAGVHEARQKVAEQQGLEASAKEQAFQEFVSAERARANRRKAFAGAADRIGGDREALALADPFGASALAGAANPPRLGLAGIRVGLAGRQAVATGSRGLPGEDAQRRIAEEALSLLDEGRLSAARRYPGFHQAFAGRVAPQSVALPVRHFAEGGLVPGSGNSDSVPALLKPGEFVLRTQAVQSLGREFLHRANRYAEGGPVRRSVYDRKAGAFRPETDEEMQRRLEDPAAHRERIYAEGGRFLPREKPAIRVERPTGRPQTVYDRDLRDFRTATPADDRAAAGRQVYDRSLGRFRPETEADRAARAARPAAPPLPAADPRRFLPPESGVRIEAPTGPPATVYDRSLGAFRPLTPEERAAWRPPAVDPYRRAGRRRGPLLPPAPTADGLPAGYSPYLPADPRTGSAFLPPASRRGGFPLPPVRRFAQGGGVPGFGDGDVVPALLQPGEFVMSRAAVRSLGHDFLHRANRMALGGAVGGGSPTGGGALPEGTFREAAAASAEFAKAVARLAAPLNAFGDSSGRLAGALEKFAGSSSALVEALDRFPRKVELGGTPRVEIVLNGADVLSRLEPGIQKAIAERIGPAVEAALARKIPDLGF